jgi:hypothetical protein
MDEKSGVSVSKNPPGNEVETITYDLKIQCTKFRNGTRSCTITDIVSDNPNKDVTAEAPAAPPQKETPVEATAAEPVDAAAKQTSGKNEEECDLCDLVEDELRKKAETEAAAKAEAAAAAKAEKPSAARRLPAWARRHGMSKS